MRLSVPFAAGGTVGMICTSLFATTTVNEYAIDGAFYGNGLHLGKTLAVLVVLVPWVAVFTWGCLFVTDKIMSLRVSGAYHVTNSAPHTRREFW
jgi:ammonia channel protein AmtB